MSKIWVGGGGGGGGGGGQAREGWFASVSEQETAPTTPGRIQYGRTSEALSLSLSLAPLAARSAVCIVCFSPSFETCLCRVRVPVRVRVCVCVCVCVRVCVCVCVRVSVGVLAAVIVSAPTLGGGRPYEVQDCLAASSPGSPWSSFLNTPPVRNGAPVACSYVAPIPCSFQRF